MMVYSNVSVGLHIAKAMQQMCSPKGAETSATPRQGHNVHEVSRHSCVIYVCSIQVTTCSSNL